MLEKFSNSWKLVKAAASVLAADRELVIFPILSTIGVIIVTLTFAVPLFLSNFFDSIFSNKLGIMGFVVAFLFYLVQYVVIFYANTALVGAAMIRLNGGDPTVRDGFRIANSRFGAIVGYALIAATVGMILKALSRRRGMVRFISSILGMAWNLATYLVVPVLAVEGLGPIAALKQSVSLLRKTWGEQIIGNFGLGLIFGIASILVVLAVIPIILLAANYQSLILFIIAIGMLFLLLTILGLINSSLNGIYTAAVYQYASTGKSSAFFEDQMVKNAFTPK
jgi:hypothetical protein